MTLPRLPPGGVSFNGSTFNEFQNMPRDFIALLFLKEVTRTLDYDSRLVFCCRNEISKKFISATRYWV